ncbi:MAG: M56 family metallopeptidase [Defluviitaleaceae bacterium]|nr:M56 family metallopeptidase [Defluviitaleaceae bacterium]
MRKLKFPIKFSVAPLLLLLVFSIMRMFVAVTIPDTVVVFSETLYPAIVNVLMREFFSISILHVLVCAWVMGTVWLSARYFYKYISNFRPILNRLGSYERDEYAESLLADIIGSDKHFCVFRNGGFRTAAATAFRPHIILPKVEFSPDELRVVLLHEWKHIQDKDYLTDMVVDVICCVFWWNPLVYVLRSNFRFVTELKSDQFAVSNKTDFRHYLMGLQLLDGTKNNEATEEGLECGAIKALTRDGDGLADRLRILAMRGESRSKMLLTNICYSILIVALFIGSYMFLVVPMHWESSYIPVSAYDFTEEYSEGGGIFRVEEHFLVDNENGTFSLYIDGIFVMYVDYDSDFVNWTPIRGR